MIVVISVVFMNNGWPIYLIMIDLKQQAVLKYNFVHVIKSIVKPISSKLLQKII